MSNLIARGLDTVREKNSQLYNALKDIVNGVNQVGVVAGIGAHSPLSLPTNNGSLSVIAANGIFDAMIIDPSAVRGEFYFLEWGQLPSFTDAVVIPLGQSRNWRGQLGNLTTYWRFYKQFIGSSASVHITFGNPATAVVGGGSAGPTPQATQGSGTARVPGHGFGPIGPGTAVR